MRSELEQGAQVRMLNPATGEVLAEGFYLEVEAPRRLVATMNALWSDEVQAEGESRVTWEIDQIGDSCCLVVTHDQLRDGGNNQIYRGWPMILSGLKTWLERAQCSPRPARSCTQGRSQPEHRRALSLNCRRRSAPMAGRSPASSRRWPAGCR